MRTTTIGTSCGHCERHANAGQLLKSELKIGDNETTPHQSYDTNFTLSEAPGAFIGSAEASAC